nr:SDR family oxidoreductase [Rhodococcus rhodochrous]
MPSRSLSKDASTNRCQAGSTVYRTLPVNAVAPGPIWTPLQPSDGQPKEELPEFGQNTPLGRAGQPTELAPAYVFLASPESSYVVGATIHVNGGMPSP